MAAKTSVKSVFFSFFCAAAVLTMCACIAQVDINLFLEDEKVQEIIEKSKEKVYIGDDSDTGLQAGDGEITGLEPNKYYKVEEYDENGAYQRVFFVSSSGIALSDMGGIGFVTGGKVTGLRNFYTYKVNSARALFNNNQELEYYKFAAGAMPVVPSTGKVTVSGGRISVAGPKFATNTHYLNLAAANAIGINNNYQVMMIGWDDPRTSGRSKDTVIGISDVSDIEQENNYDKYDENRDIGIYQFRTTVATFGGKSLIELPGANTTVDFIFAEYNSNKEISKFSVLTVAVTGSEADRIQVTVTYSGVNSPKVKYDSSSYAQNINDQIEFTIENITDYSSFEWFLDGTPVSTASSFTLDTSLIANKMEGVYNLTVIAVKDNIPYSTTVEITVTRS